MYWGTDFIGCTFYDLTIYYPLTNFVQIGGDVLVRPSYLSSLRYGLQNSTYVLYFATSTSTKMVARDAHFVCRVSP